MDLDGIVYRRLVLKQRMGAERINQLTGGILHMTRRDKWMTLAEIINEAESYNGQFQAELDHFDIETDPFLVAQQLSLLASVNLVEVAYMPFVRADLEAVRQREEKHASV